MPDFYICGKICGIEGDRCGSRGNWKIKRGLSECKAVDSGQEK